MAPLEGWTVVKCHWPRLGKDHVLVHLLLGAGQDRKGRTTLKHFRVDGLIYWVLSLATFEA
jgi:hypothetical protein